MLNRINKPKPTNEELNHVIAQELYEARVHLEIMLTHWLNDKINLPASLSADFQKAYEFMLKPSNIKHLEN